MATTSAVIASEDTAPHGRSPRRWGWPGEGATDWLDALLPLIFALQLFRSQELLATGLLLIWLALRLVSQAVRQVRQRPAGTPWAALMLGLLLVNVRVVLFGEESSPSGPSDLLMVVLGLAAGAGRRPASWRASLQWIGLATLPVVVLLALHWPGSLDFSTPLEVVLEQKKVGIGGLNRVATLAMLFSVCAAYGGLLEKTGWKRLALLATALLGYGLCLRTGSRLALLAPLLAMAMAYLISRARGRLKAGQAAGPQQRPQSPLRPGPPQGGGVLRRHRLFRSEPLSVRHRLRHAGAGVLR
jgi:hypothetical protein